MKYETKLIMHAHIRGGGVINVFELVDFPGVKIADTFEKRGAKGKRQILFDEYEYDSIADAVEAWKWQPSSD